MMERTPKRVRDLIERMDAALDAIDAVCMRLGVHGLQRASRSSVAELQALQQTAQAAGLILVAREIDALATHLRRYLDRDPLFTTDDYAGGLNRIWLLGRATRARRAEGALPADMLDLIGRARRQFEPVEGPLQVQALAARGWVTDSGYVGVTVFLREAGAADPRALVQINNARPTLHFGDDPTTLYRAALSEALGMSARDLAHGAWRLDGARRSHDDRLSMHAGLQVAPAAAVGGAAWAPFRAASWAAVLQRLRAEDAHPLRRADGALIYIEPGAVGPIAADPVRAVARAPLTDARGAQMTLYVPLRTENNLLMDNLERITRHRGPSPRGWFGRAWVAEDELRFTPMTAVYPKAVAVHRMRQRVHALHLSLERLAAR